MRLLVNGPTGHWPINKMNAPGRPFEVDALTRDQAVADAGEAGEAGVGLADGLRGSLCEVGAIARHLGVLLQLGAEVRRLVGRSGLDRVGGLG